MNTFSQTYAKRILLLSLVILGMGFSVLFPVLAPLGREIGFSELQITSIIAVSSLTVFLCSPIWGRLSDRWGRKRVMLTGLCGFALGTIAFNSMLHVALSGWLIGIPMFLLLIGTRIMHAGVMSATMPAANAYMADITSISERTKGMGAAGAANNVGAILGPSLGSLAVISLLAPLWVMAAFAVLNALIVWRFLPQSPHIRTRVKSATMRYTDRRILPFIVVGVTMFAGFAVVQQTIGFRFQDALGLGAAETAKTVGFGMMCSAAASVFAQAVVVQRLNIAPFTLLKLAMPLLAVALGIMALFATLPTLMIAMTVMGFAMGLAGPGFMAGASLAVSPEEQGAVAGVAGACGPLGFTIGPILGALLYQVDPALPYAVAASVYLVLLVCMQWLGKTVTQHQPDPQSTSEKE